MDNTAVIPTDQPYSAGSGGQPEAGQPLAEISWVTPEIPRFGEYTSLGMTRSSTEIL